MKAQRKKDIIKEEPTTPDQQIKKSIGRKIKQERDRRNQSAERIAKRLGLSRVGLTHIEKGRNNINAVQIWKLACTFGCDPSDLFPPIPKGFAVTRVDYQKIAREDESAVEWAQELFSDEF